MNHLATVTELFNMEVALLQMEGRTQTNETLSNKVIVSSIAYDFGAMQNEQLTTPHVGEMALLQR